MKNGFVTVYFWWENLKKHNILSDFWKKKKNAFWGGKIIWKNKILFFLSNFEEFLGQENYAIGFCSIFSLKLHVSKRVW